MSAKRHVAFRLPKPETEIGRRGVHLTEFVQSQWSPTVGEETLKIAVTGTPQTLSSRPVNGQAAFVREIPP